ncbi:MAG TPA: YggS family pyridoxal phosphate-dependent enzyme [Acholeplasma sp.]|jgi:pyridoxal phosphate enzyme (YggS family)
MTNFLEYKDNIVCASKYFTTNDMRKIFNLGIKHFGENRVQDLLSKKEELKSLPITWHFIGHLQTNKVKQVINEIDYLHSLDSLKLAKEIQKYRVTPLNTFIQLNLSKEESKFGIDLSELKTFVKELTKYDKINLIGFMTIGIQDDLIQTEKIFETLNQLKIDYMLQYTSMGMSNDYELAIKHHADWIRIGSLFKGVI